MTERLTIKIESPITMGGAQDLGGFLPSGYVLLIGLSFLALIAALGLVSFEVFNAPWSQAIYGWLNFLKPLFS